MSLLENETKKSTPTPAREKGSANRSTETCHWPCRAVGFLFQTGLFGFVENFTQELGDGQAVAFEGGQGQKDPFASNVVAV